MVTESPTDELDDPQLDRVGESLAVAYRSRALPGSLAHEGALVRLRAAVLSLDREPTAELAEPVAVAAMIEGLLAGEWSLVHAFEREGRHHLMMRRGAPAPRDPSQLTLREREVLRCAMRGLANKCIAFELGLAISTVATHLASAKRKLGVRCRLQLIQLMAAGVIDG